MDSQIAEGRGLADARAELGSVAQHLCAAAQRQCTGLADEGSYTQAVTDGF
ncbi:UNVERIFIED_CONTAM: hypothetical protein Sangu_3114300 [Sesamum angustifolium]|uniref:Uncharacterized protein n=1 Tax=Sesamum angustifolium TaxID=2727405 RepID=A0AAW2K6B7_9LAMI